MKLCVDYILGNIEQKLKIRPSETKPSHKMRTRGFEPGVNGIPSTFPTGLTATPQALWFSSTILTINESPSSCITICPCMLRCRLNEYVKNIQHVRNRAENAYDHLQVFIMKIFEPHRWFIPLWNKVFLLFSVLSLFIDPLFFFIPVVEGIQKCVQVDQNLLIY
ncbi:hypothetical protein OSB04_007321 [Centaurea solstitialis]|uniref:Uncharacterized protein n=1 Tax=Centaurea solstitialis TaxID=347529 RepID=A0AA38WT75_9ASTR|nr:hypothetical protein OSB04_007321 [Centaurea solstitialis]